MSETINGANVPATDDNTVTPFTVEESRFYQCLVKDGHDPLHHKVLEKTYEIRAKLLGNGHDYTHCAASSLADSYRYFGNREKAAEIIDSLVIIPPYSDDEWAISEYADNLSWLGRQYCLVGRPDKVKIIMLDLYDLLKKHELDDIDERISNCLQSLAWAYYEIGDTDNYKKTLDKIKNERME